MKKCPYCAEDIQDAAVVCKHCGRELPGMAPAGTAPPPKAGTPAAPAARVRLRRSTQLWLLALLLVVGALVVVRASQSGGSSGSAAAPSAPPPYRVSIGDGQPQEIKSESFMHYDFDLPNQVCHITGRILGLAGGHKDFQAFLMDDDNFINWSNTHAARAYWQTERVAAATIDARVAGPGKFHLVISNVWSVFTAKTVTVQGQAEC